MDSTKDSPRPGSRSWERMLERDARDQNATGSNAGPTRRAFNEDAIQGTTSAEASELRGKPEKGSRFSGDA